MNPLQPTYGGGYNNAFLAKINPSGSALVYSTNLGGNVDEVGFGIAVNSSGGAYVTGLSGSPNFPTKNPLQPTYGGGGDVFVAKINPSGSALVYSTYLGGSEDDVGMGIAVDSAGNSYVTGYTNSSNFPTTAGAFQTSLAGPEATNTFLTALDPSGSALVNSTYLCGSAFDFGYGIALDTLGNAYVTGWAFSNNFPTTAGAFQTTFGGVGNVFVAKFENTPQAQVANLANTVKALVSTGTLNPGLGQFLLAPLKAALAALGTTPATAARAASDLGDTTPAPAISNGGCTAAAILDLDAVYRRCSTSGLLPYAEADGGPNLNQCRQQPHRGTSRRGSKKATQSLAFLRLSGSSFNCVSFRQPARAHDCASPTPRRCLSWSTLCPDAALTQFGYACVIQNTNGELTLIA